MGGENSMFSTAWNIIAADSPLYVINDIGDYANMNMVFIFGGIMVSIFIGHDYKSGYVKQLFTTHPKKQDYMISKSLLGAFSMACMCVTYFIGGTLAGAGGITACMFAKIFFALVFVAIALVLAVTAKRRLWLSILCSFGAGMLLFTMIPMITPLNSTIINVVMCLAGGAVFAVGLGAISNVILRKTNIV